MQLMGSQVMVGQLVVVSASNPIHRVAGQVVIFTVGAQMFMELDYYFQGLTYIIVYVGAIAIQFQFVIMMVQIPGGETAVKGSSSPLFSNGTPTLEGGKNQPTGVYGIIGNKYTPVAESASTAGKIRGGVGIINIIGQAIKPFGSLLTPGRGLQMGVIISCIYLSMIFKQGNGVYGVDIYSYNYPIWATDFKTITDIESQAIMVYVAYPAALIQVGISQWTVLIGVISICSPRI